VSVDAGAASFLGDEQDDAVRRQTAATATFHPTPWYAAMETFSASAITGCSEKTEARTDLRGRKTFRERPRIV
jgi:hypothetical protein